MPCYDSRDNDDKAHNRLAAGLLCELLKAERARVERSAELTQKLEEWFTEHRKRETS